MLLFFDGVDYLFGDSEAQNLGRYKNGMCVGRGLVLDPREPPDSGEGSVRMLRYMPLAIFVQPSSKGNRGLRRGMPGIPDNCIPVQPITICTTPKVKRGAPFPGPPTFTLSNGSKVTGFYFKRTGSALSPAYALTDFCVQGASLGNATWLLHLTPPSDGKLSRAAVLVSITRFCDADAVKLLCPLWPEDATEEEIAVVVKKFMAASAVKRELVDEMLRLKAAAEQTAADLAPLRARIMAAVAARKAQIASVATPV